MLVGSMSVDLFIAGAASLKEKRRHLKSVIEKIKYRFNVSIAEVEQQELWQRSTIGIACVSNERVHVDKTLAAVINFIESQSSVEIINYNYEIL